MLAQARVRACVRAVRKGGRSALCSLAPALSAAARFLCCFQYRVNVCLMLVLYYDGDDDEDGDGDEPKHS
jgi:hypothetical protein